jgi:hypothetical protein
MEEHSDETTKLQRSGFASQERSAPCVRSRATSPFNGAAVSHAGQVPKNFCIGPFSEQMLQRSCGFTAEKIESIARRQLTNAASTELRLHAAERFLKDFYEEFVAASTELRLHTAGETKGSRTGSRVPSRFNVVCGSHRRRAERSPAYSRRVQQARFNEARLVAVTCAESRTLRTLRVLFRRLSLIASCLKSRICSCQRAVPNVQGCPTD